MKRERALAYSISPKVINSCFRKPHWWKEKIFANMFSTCFQASRTNRCPYSRTRRYENSPKMQKQDKNSPGLSWSTIWMAAKPWETVLIEEPQLPRKSEDGHSVISRPNSSKRNDSTPRIYPKSPVISQISRSSSDPSSEFLYDGSSESTSSCSTMVEENHANRPNYMNLTESTKAKQKASKNPFSFPRLSVEDAQLQLKSMAISPSVKPCNDLYPPVQLDRSNRIKPGNCLFWLRAGGQQLVVLINYSETNSIGKNLRRGGC